jgi:hypothetical protein
LANEFDWRAWERKLDALNQFKSDGALVGTFSPKVNRFVQDLGFQGL